MPFGKSGTNTRGALPKRSIKSLSRTSVRLMILAPLLAAVLIISLLTKPPSQAAKIEDIEYEVGTATITPRSDGNCRVALPYTIKAPNEAIAEHIKEAALKAPSPGGVAKDGTRIVSAVYGDPQVAGTTVTMQVAHWPR